MCLAGQSQHCGPFSMSIFIVFSVSSVIFVFSFCWRSVCMCWCSFFPFVRSLCIVCMYSLTGIVIVFGFGGGLFVTVIL